MYGRKVGDVKSVILLFTTSVVLLVLIVSLLDALVVPAFLTAPKNSQRDLIRSIITIFVNQIIYFAIVLLLRFLGRRLTHGSLDYACMVGTLLILLRAFYG